MIGILLGLLFGGVQLYLLIRGTASLGSGRIAVWPFVVQFFCPLAGLLLCAAVRSHQLIACGSAMCVVLIGGALVRVALSRKQKEDHKED